MVVDLINFRRMQGVLVLVLVLLILANVVGVFIVINGESAVGDPGMKRDGLRVAFEAWNFCNEVGHEAPKMGSPRAADCFDLVSDPLTTRKHQQPFAQKSRSISLN